MSGRPPLPEQRSNREHNPRIFLSHASEDKPQVEKLYHQLIEAGYHPWLDKYDLLPGQDWRREIEKIICDPYNLVVVCLSNNSTTKRGVVQQEIKWALDVLDQIPEDTIYLIPARLEPCQVPGRVSNLHWVDLFEADGLEKLVRALEFEIDQRFQDLTLKQTTRTEKYLEPEMRIISAGEFLMGSNPDLDKHTRDEELPQHWLYLPDYYLAKTLVTNAQYSAFVQATGHRVPGHWVNGQFPTEKQDHPVVNVSWHDALAYCDWLSEVTARTYRLPTEAEWEKAARGSDGRIYPWGNLWDSQRCNSVEGGKKDTTPVDAYPTGASAYRLLDMSGNVWEWTLSLWGEDKKKPEFGYPYDPTDGREDPQASSNVRRVLRGGSFYGFGVDARCAVRYAVFPTARDWTRGFRLALTHI